MKNAHQKGKSGGKGNGSRVAAKGITTTAISRLEKKVWLSVAQKQKFDSAPHLSAPTIKQADYPDLCMNLVEFRNRSYYASSIRWPKRLLPRWVSHHVGISDENGPAVAGVDVSSTCKVIALSSMAFIRKLLLPAPARRDIFVWTGKAII